MLRPPGSGEREEREVQSLSACLSVATHYAQCSDQCIASALSSSSYPQVQPARQEDRQAGSLTDVVFSV